MPAHPAHDDVAALPEDVLARAERWAAEDPDPAHRDTLRAELDAGRLRSAVARYRGPVLPPSEAPGVEEIRDDLHRQLRGRLLASSDPDALLAFADTAYGRDDFELWSRVLRVLPPSSSRLTEVTEHLVQLDHDLR